MHSKIVTLVVEYDDSYYTSPEYWDWVSLLDCEAQVVGVIDLADDLSIDVEGSGLDCE